MTTLKQDFQRTTCSRSEWARRYRSVKGSMLTAISAQPTEKDAKVLLAELDLEFCKRSAAYFLFRHCRTLNSRPDEARGETLVSLFPRYRYLWLLIKSFEEHVRTSGKSRYSGITIVSKSRQLIISWLYCALFLWEVMFRPGRTTLFHSTDEYRVGFGGTGDMEQCLLGRVLFMYDNLPDHIRDRCPMRRQNSPHPTMTFYHPAQKGMTGDYLMSRIIGIPDVPHRILNTFAPTGIFDDEVSLQLKPPVFYQAAVPTIGLNCRYIIVATSTAAVPESRTWFRDLWYGADSSDDPDKAEPEPEELMPLEDSYVGCVLKDIRAGNNDIPNSDRLLGRRKRDKAVTFMLWFNADPRKGRMFAADERAKFTEAQFEQEYNNNWEISESSRLVWRIEEKPYRFRRVMYDATQKPPFDVLYVAVDGGGHAAATFVQLQKHPRAVPKGYTFAILGELDQPGAHAPVFYREMFRRWLEWFGRVPYRCFPDVAGKQEGWRDRTTDIKLMTNIARDVFDKNFTTFQGRIPRIGGIAEISEKCVEIIGYEEDDTPIPGLVVNTERAPVTARGLKGALIQDPKDGTIARGKGNTRYQHTGDCYSEDTQVLTKDGWRYFSEVSTETELATRSADGELEYQRPTEVFWYRYAGPMVELTNKRCRLLVTPNHRMLVNRDGAEQIVQARNLKKRDTIPMRAKWEGDDLKTWVIPEFRSERKTYPRLDIDAGDFFEFMGWYLAEGCVAHRKPGKQHKEYDVCISAVGPNDAKRIEPLLHRLPWTVRCYPKRGGYRIFGAQMWSYLAPVGNAYTKRIPRVMLEVSPRLLNRLWTGYMFGDGWIGSSGTVRTATVSEGLLDDLQEVALKTGRAFSKFRRTNLTYTIRGRTGVCSDQFQGVEKSSGDINLHDNRGQSQMQVTQYEGMVGCATVPNGTLFVRRGYGYPVWCGNCIKYTAFRVVKYEDIVKPADLLVKPPPPETHMTRNQRISQILEGLADDAERQARSRDPHNRYRRIYQT